MGEKFAKLKEENKILVMLAFYSISLGIWKNFQQLWLQDNNMDISTISKILSVSGLFCAIALLIFSNKITLNKIKKVISSAIFLRTINLLILFLINHSGMTIIIDILIITDTILEKIIVITIYPFIVTVKKDDKLYSKRKLVEYLFSDIGILIGGIFIGKTIANIVVNYNTCLLMSVIFLTLAFIVVYNIKQQKVKETKVNAKEVIKYLVKDKIMKTYMLWCFVSHIAMNTGLGLKMLMLTNIFKMTDSVATNYLLIIGLIADIIGILALKYLTPKSEYVTLTIKFVIRFALYAIAFFSNNLIMCLIAITWSILISTAYENVCDGVYINRVPNEYQTVFTNYRYILTIIGTSIGVYFAGLVFPLGAPYILGLSAFFMIFQIELGYHLIYLREKENKKIDKEDINNKIQMCSDS